MGNNNNKIVFFFITGAVAVGAGCYFIRKYLKEKESVKVSIDGNTPPVFKPETIEEVQAEVIEQPLTERRRLSKAEIIFNNACRETIRKRITYSRGMNPKRKAGIMNAINNLNCNPALQNEKVKIYNSTMKNFNLMQEKIFSWALRNSR